MLLIKMLTQNAQVPSSNRIRRISKRNFTLIC